MLSPDFLVQVLKFIDFAVESIQMESWRVPRMTLRGLAKVTTGGKGVDSTIPPNIGVGR